MKVAGAGSVTTKLVAAVNADVNMNVATLCLPKPVHPLTSVCSRITATNTAVT